MKLLALIIMGLFTLGNSLSAQTAERNKKILVAYFSCTGTTEKVAEAIANESGGKLYKITPVEAYTSANLDWQKKPQFCGNGRRKVASGFGWRDYRPKRLQYSIPRLPYLVGLVSPSGQYIP